MLKYKRNQNKEGDFYMNSLISFLNAFMSYLLLMAVIVVIAGVAVFIGIKMRKSKNEKEKSLE